MANIKRILRGYICDEREKNWTKEYAKREIERHKTNKILDHPDESVTTKKLAKECVTKEKLESEISELIERNKEGVISLAAQLQNEIQERVAVDNLKADKATTLSGYGIEDAYNKDEVDDKIKQVSIEEVEYSDIDNIIESGVYKLMQGDGTTRQGDGMWLVVSRSSDPIDPVIYVIQYMFSPASSEIKSRIRNPMGGEWFDWESIGNGSVDLSDYYTKTEVDDLVGDIETALDSIIMIQNGYTGEIIIPPEYNPDGGVDA